MKKLVAIIVVIVMVTAVFTACAETTVPESSADTSAEQATQEATETDPEESEAAPAEEGVTERLDAMAAEYGWQQPFWYEEPSENTLKMAESALDGSVLNFGPNGEEAVLEAISSQL